MLALTHQLESRLQNISYLFGPLAPDGALPIQFGDYSGGPRLTLMLDSGQLRDPSYCKSQVAQIRRLLKR
ncbi:hypothetical protein NS376_23365 [Pseudomonas oryzihabitans]|nr:hypothetical protein NS376_23365 [Pseudomonas psychrotolerans]KTT60281.1 hypothetical protein SB8_01450 [Pseudomonas psychrotolerans]